MRLKYGWQPLGLADAVAGGACEGRLDVVVHGGLRGILRGVSNRRSVGAARLSGPSVRRRCACGRRLREVSNRRIRKAGGVGAVEVGSEREHNAKLIPVKMATPWID